MLNLDWITPLLSLLRPGATVALRHEHTWAYHALKRQGIHARLPNYTGDYFVFDVPRKDEQRTRSLLTQWGIL